MKKLILLITTVIGSSILSLSAQTNDYTDQKENDVVIHSDNRLDRLMAKKLAMSKDNNFVSVYRIQLFSGSRSGSNESLKKIKKSHANQYANINYDQPNFKTKIGAYRTEMEAEKQLNEFRKIFPSAFVLKERIPFEELIKKRNTKSQY